MRYYVTLITCDIIYVHISYYMIYDMYILTLKYNKSQKDKKFKLISVKKFFLKIYTKNNDK